jgi:hypothetical protein
LLLLTGCGGGRGGNFDLDIPGGYSILSTSVDQVTISPKINNTNWENYVIPPKVIEVAWDDNYILAKQLGLEYVSNNSYQTPNKDDVNFWILEIIDDNVYGPFNEVDFVKKKAELGISESVRLKKIEDLE